MNSPPSEGSGRLRRWLHENVADTRTPGEPQGRIYAAPFALIWDEVLAQVESNRGWSLAHQDEELGIISVTCQSLVLRLIDDLTVWVGLDDDGLTTVQIRSAARVGSRDLGVNRRRVERLLARLDERAGPEARIRPRPSGQRDARSSS